MKTRFTALVFGGMLLLGGCRTMDSSSPTALQLGGTGKLEIIVMRHQITGNWSGGGYAVHVDGKFLGRYRETDISFPLKAGERTVHITPVETKDVRYDPSYIEGKILILGDATVQGFRARFNVIRE